MASIVSGWRLLPGTGASLDRALEEVHGPADRRWCVLVEGSAEDVDYLCGVSGPSRTLTLPPPRRGGAALALELPGDAQLAGLLEAAAATAAVIRAVAVTPPVTARLDELAADPDAAVAAASVAVRRDLGEPPMLRIAGTSAPTRAAVGAGLESAEDTAPAARGAAGGRLGRGPVAAAVAAAALVPALLAALLLGPRHGATPLPTPPPQGAVESVPADRGGPAAAWDRVTHRLVLYGGFGRGAAVRGLILDDTWSWTSAGWALAADGAGPPARVAGSMVVDPATGDLLLTGGYGNGGAGPLGDTWLWDGGRWVSPTRAQPPASVTLPPVAVWRGAAVLLTLAGDTTANAATWRWNGAYWERLTVASPPLRSTAVMGADPRGGPLLLVERAASGGSGETWEFDGTRWRALPDSGPVAFDPLSARVGWDPQSRRLLLVELTGGAARVLAWTAGAWRDAGIPGPPREAVSLVTDTDTGRLLALVSGSAGLEVLALQGGSWRAPDTGSH